LVDIVIRDARLVLPKSIVRGSLAVEGERITKIARTGIPKGEREIDAKGKILIPGVIDAHAHIYDPKYLHREDFRHGTIAAAAGGVTCIIAMPLDTPMLTPEEVKKTIMVGKRESLIDFSLHCGNMTTEAIKYIPEVAALGVKSFKAFTCAPYHLYGASIEEMMKVAKKVKSIAFIHAEDDEILWAQAQLLHVDEREDPLAHAEAHPNSAEAKAVERVISYARQTGCHLHLAHITTREGAKLVAQAKAKRTNISAEVCPHHLIFTKDDVRKLGPYLRFNPPPRSKQDIAALWPALAKGALDIVTSDHAPGTRKEKEIGWKNIWNAQIGIPGIETMLPLMFSEGVMKKRISLKRLVDAMCTSPAKIFGLYPRKGVIQVGSDADLVLIDQKKQTTIKGKKLHYKVGWTPYEGREVKGMPATTISRGTVIVEDGKVIGKAGRGKFLAR
jgi:dihydroorotase (multifunctional complex type)